MLVFPTKGEVGGSGSSWPSSGLKGAVTPTGPQGPKQRKLWGGFR